MILLIAKTPKGSRELMLDGDHFAIGRAPNNEIFLDDPRASRIHAHIRKKPEGYLLVDAGSSNGTRVGTDRIDRKFLKADDIITIGSSTITVLAIKGVQPQTPAPKSHPSLSDDTPADPLQAPLVPSSDASPASDFEVPDLSEDTPGDSLEPVIEPSEKPASPPPAPDIGGADIWEEPVSDPVPVAAKVSPPRSANSKPPRKATSKKIPISRGKQLIIASKPDPTPPDPPEAVVPPPPTSRAAEARKNLTNRMRLVAAPEREPHDFLSFVKTHFALILVFVLLIAAGILLPSFLSRLKMAKETKNAPPVAADDMDLYELRQLKARASKAARVSDLMLQDAKVLADKYAEFKEGKNSFVEFHRSLLFRRTNEPPIILPESTPRPPVTGKETTDSKPTPEALPPEPVPENRDIPEDVIFADIFPLPDLIPLLQKALKSRHEISTGDLPGTLLQIDKKGVTIRTAQEDLMVSWNMVSPQTIWAICTSIPLSQDETITLCRYGFEKDLGGETEALLRRWVGDGDAGRKEKADQLLAEIRGEIPPEGGYVWSEDESTFVPATRE